MTGAGGFIGNAICRRLAVEGAEVLGLDVNSETADRVIVADPTWTLPAWDESDLAPAAITERVAVFAVRFDSGA